jgi:uncharacterized membrane protein (UPF0127 family)
MEKNKLKGNADLKRKMFRVRIIAAILLIVFAGYFIFKYISVKNQPVNEEVNKETEKPMAFTFQKQGVLIFSDEKDKIISKIDIEIADNEDKRMTGLMYRDKMNENQGMLFLFPDEEQQAFWMKNTILPLDIIFINAKREVVSIQKNAEPYSEKSLPSFKPAQYVVEVNAGYTDKYAIKEGTMVAWTKD